MLTFNFLVLETSEPYPTSKESPLIHISCLLYVLLPLNFHYRPPKAAMVFRFVRNLQPWGMMEVFLLGILISIVKLADMAEISPGIALYSLGALIFVVATLTSVLDTHSVWERIGVEK